MEFSNWQCCPGRCRGTRSHRNTIGWVVSGPLESSLSTDRERAVSVNIIGRDGTVPGRLERDVQVLWDLEMLGITKSHGAYEEFVEAIHVQ